MLFGHRKQKWNRLVASGTALLCCGVLFLCQGLPASAAEASIEERLEQQRAIPIQTNQVPNWPAGPVVSAESAILMEMDTGTILYEKNIHQKQYPASITKILTALIAAEECSMDETVTFSHDAIFDNPPGSSGIAMDVGQTLTMEQCLNAILIRSANEVSFAVAEHISGSSDWSAFAETMNLRAKEMGCLNTHFTNPNGLPDDDHYSTAYDLAMIGRGFFANELLCQITLTKRLEIPASDTIPQAKIENNIMQIIPGGAYAYPYLVGCKTGYTSVARSSLISCAERNGMKLICVVMRDESPLQYEDTISLFDYGFSNFDKVNVSQTETKYAVDDMDLFYSGTDILGDARPLLVLNKDDSIILPRTAAFHDIDSSVSFQPDKENQVAVIQYTYHGAKIGSVRVDFAAAEQEDALFEPSESADNPSRKQFVFINVLKILGAAAILSVLFLIVFLLRSIGKNFSFSIGLRRLPRKKNRPKRGLKRGLKFRSSKRNRRS